MKKSKAIEMLELRRRYYNTLYQNASEENNEEDRQYFLGKANGIDEALGMVMSIEFEDWTSDNRNEELE